MLSKDERKRLEQVEPLEIPPYMEKDNWRAEARRRRYSWQAGGNAQKQGREP